MDEIINAYTILVEKPEGKRTLGRFRCGWKDHSNMDLRELGCEPDSDQWRTHDSEPAGNFLTS
jgi:hypothetical protein